MLVELDPNLPVLAGAHWINRRWLLLIRYGEPLERQRFSLAHEYKHCIDYPTRTTLYGDAAAATVLNRQAELAADAFAAALLMPASWVQEAWGDGDRDPARLAERFCVSERAMTRRLQALGLGPSQPTYQEAA